jgi:ADP-ribose pyrophosphatase YjhB (NUDIX family)
MNYKEFFEEGTVIESLQVKFIDTETYTAVHQNTVIVCHDVFIKCTHNNVTGYLLVKRLNHPAKDIYWPIGGRILRGLTTEESLLRKTKDECSLTLHDIQYVATARTFFKDDPFDHSKGTDTLNLVFIARGEGTVQLNKLHDEPLIVTQDLYKTMRPTLDPYVQTYLDYIDTNNLW